MCPQADVKCQLIIKAQYFEKFSSQFNETHFLDYLCKYFNHFEVY